MKFAALDSHTPSMVNVMSLDLPHTFCRNSFFPEICLCYRARNAFL